ncbi:MAG: MBL fold metallo-hydrolase [Candidatus Omnitrophica bacterium]|nr:MBL fold metallo-hydrolase [Candidatus Omnitrophota bacterium]
MIIKAFKLIIHVLFLSGLLFWNIFSLQAQEQKINYIPINHASFILQSAELNIYVDPVGDLEQYRSFRAADIILITHNHHDHLDTKIVEAVKKDGALIIGSEDVINELGFGFVIKNGESQHLGDIIVQSIPMYNLTKDRLKFHPKGKGNGYVITLQGKRIYISGDTEDIPEMRQLKNIDYAFVCMNLPYTMSVEQAASAVLDFKPKVVIPYHYRGPDGFSDIVKFKKLVSQEKSISVECVDWYDENK